MVSGTNSTSSSMSTQRVITESSATIEDTHTSSHSVLKEENAADSDASVELACFNDPVVVDYEPFKCVESDDESYLNLPPGRMNATRVPDVRLRGRSSGDLHIPPGLTTILRKRAEVLPGGAVVSSSPLSRSRSPSVNPDGKATTTTTDANSSISSLEDIVDRDILYDRCGFTELNEMDVINERRKLHNCRDYNNLPPLCERFSDDNLEDAHAFADPIIVRSSNASRTNSIGTGADQYLEPLNEEGEDDDLDDITEEGDSEPETQVIVTNLDNLSIAEYHLMADRERARGTAENSLMEEAPSAPTA